MNRRKAISVVLAAGVLPAILQTPRATAGNDYPVRPIRMIVPWPAGGVADAVTRRLAARMERELGQPVVVENKPGASGMIGAQYVAQAAPDGYTILAGDLVTHAVNPYLFKSIQYDAVRDFAPISLRARASVLLAVHPSLPVASVPELVAYAKANPGGIQYGAPVGSPQQLTAELFRRQAGIELTHVPYKGEALALPDLVAGQLQMMFVFVAPSLGFIQGGKLRALAVAHGKRVPALPAVPTFGEVGFPGMDLGSWGAVFAPAGTPRPIIDKLNVAVVKSVSDPQEQEFQRKLGAEAVTSTPEELAAFLKSEQGRWAEIVRRAGVQLD